MLFFYLDDAGLHKEIILMIFLKDILYLQKKKHR